MHILSLPETIYKHSIVNNGLESLKLSIAALQKMPATLSQGAKNGL